MTVSSIISKLLRALLVVVLLGLAGWFFLWYDARPANRFCDSLALGDTRDRVINAARAAGYAVTAAEGGKILRTSASDNPWFSMACVTTFDADKVIRKEVQATD
ncbi:MAG: hypothetical protein DSZ33_05075 [Gammaproteobacteria bacterium]|nr:MAG: hypothetical protein DSZ33_05075 [Gammaproteobacteria bacterium]